MNERIRELAKQCWDQRLDGKHFDQEQFAKLIVRECIETLGSYEDYWNHYEQMEMLKKHFGVEE